MLVKLVSTCEPVAQADKPKKSSKVHKFFVSLLMLCVVGATVVELSSLLSSLSERRGSMEDAHESALGVDDGAPKVWLEWVLVFCRLCVHFFPTSNLGPCIKDVKLFVREK